MSLVLANILHITAFVCIALLFVGLFLPILVSAIAALILAIIGFILVGWAWQLRLLLLISAIFFMFWWAGRQRSPYGSFVHHIAKKSSPHDNNRAV